MADSSFCIRVNVQPAAYDVNVAPGLMQRLGEAVRQLSSAGRIGVVSDSNVAGIYLEKVSTSLKAAGFEVLSVTVPAGEQHKTLDTISRIYDTLLPAGLDRQTPLLALGGGVVGDMTGFAAATILRGVPFIQVPTTLLSMVDASVGGKTGIDHPCGKNLIGSFHQPVAVLIDPEALLTLPERELIGGLAECIKHDVIRDAQHFTKLGEVLSKAIKRDVSALSELVAHNVAIKAKVVELDPKEKGERAHLNFGHTFGHAFESVSQFKYSHGESVALGMVAASRAAGLLGILDNESIASITRTIASAGLPTGGLKLDTAACMRAMAFDKKVSGKKVRFVLPDAIGHVVIRDDVPQDVIVTAIESLR